MHRHHKARNRRLLISSAFAMVAILLLSFLLFSPAHMPIAHAAGAKFEPADGKTILMIGQAQSEISDYTRSAGAGMPGGYMMYTSVQNFEGLTSSYRGSGCGDGGTQNLQDWINNYPNTILQLGLYMAGILPAINSGQYDNNLHSLATILKNTNRPIFLRIGYEFDGPWNAYNPSDYVSAYQRIVNIFRNDSVNNVAFVWHSAAYNTYNNSPISSWYPGDSYIDWVGISWFPWAASSDNQAAANARATMLNFAQQHGKPLMIAESAGKSYYQPNNANAWNGWFVPVMNWIAQNNVKAWSYINQNWNAQGMWQAGCNNGTDWGDTRVQMPGTTMLSNWDSAVGPGSSRYLNAGSALYNAIGFTSGGGSIPTPTPTTSRSTPTPTPTASGSSVNIPGTVATNIGAIANGSHVSWTVNVTTAGNYRFDITSNSSQNSQLITIALNGSSLQLAIDSGKTISAYFNGVSTGSHTLTITANSGSVSLSQVIAQTY